MFILLTVIDSDRGVYMKKMFLLMIFTILFIFNGCAASPPVSPSEELVMSSWTLKSENEGGANKSSNGSLSFNEDKICLSLKKGDGSRLKINDIFEIDDNSIVIISEKLGTLKLTYRLRGDELELSLDDSTLYFRKES